tara:strand:- start:602 stop:757 length:156 start_codon:yes stop_codon:yes gene_type:complete
MGRALGLSNPGQKLPFPRLAWNASSSGIVLPERLAADEHLANPVRSGRKQP